MCNVTRFYSCVQRRYGQFTCVTCYRYFRTFLLKPKKYACPNLGDCPLNVRTRCRACWIKACISVFSVDARRQQVIQANLPVRKAGTMINSGSPIKQPPQQQQKPQVHNMSAFPGQHHQQQLQKASAAAAIDYHATENGDDHEVDRDSVVSSHPPTPSNHSTGGYDNSMLEPEVSLTEDHDTSGQHETDENMENGEDSIHHPIGSPLSDADLQESQVSPDHLVSHLSDDNKLIITGKKVWSCGKCLTCTAEDCGKCIYCLDRPKFGGPFIKKQRCIKRRCLMKIKNRQATLLKK